MSRLTMEIKNGQRCFWEKSVRNLAARDIDARLAASKIVETPAAGGVEET